MSTAIIITICVLLLLAYIFDISSTFTKIPSIILLLLLGGVVKQVILILPIELPDLSPVLPIIGNIGLILIVLEASLELELNKTKLRVIKNSFLIALIPMVIVALIIGYTFYYFGLGSFNNAILNAIPFCVISSAIAIPSVKSLSNQQREFVIYESSLSDILGILFFNFIAFNQIINIWSFGTFAIQIVIIILVSFISVLGLSFMLSRIKHHITYAPIILLVVLIYMISKVYHLPGLIFILIFGLFLGNLNDIKHLKWIEKLHPDKLIVEVQKFRGITYEATFLVRSLFFLLFGFLMDIKELLNFKTLPWAIGIVLLIIMVRSFTLRTFNLPTSPLLYIAPRGLITILLFLSIIPEHKISIVNNSLIIQTIILSVIAMMIGLLANREDKINFE